MVSRSLAKALCFVLASLLLMPGTALRAEVTVEPTDVTDESVATQPQLVVDFMRDVHPILAEKCLKCHGPEDAKNDFRVDDLETFLAYIEPGDLESSSLWADYLMTEDPDMRMPPVTEDPTAALTGAQLATIKLWIEEGAQCSDVEMVESEPLPTVPHSTIGRVWAFQGIFHPATVHFPVALLTVSAAFVLFSFFRPESCEPVAFHCLWIGAIGAIVACVAGWAYAVHEGYGQSFTLDLQNSAIDRHRWLGIGVAGLAVILIPMAASVRRTGDTGMRFMWLLGSIFMVGAVSFAGYQGGELTYGEDHYAKEFERLFPEAASEMGMDESLGDPEVKEAAPEPEVVILEAVVPPDVVPKTDSESQPEPADETQTDPPAETPSEPPAASVSEIDASSEAPPTGNTPPPVQPPPAPADSPETTSPAEEPAPESSPPAAEPAAEPTDDASDEVTETETDAPPAERPPSPRTTRP